MNGFELKTGRKIIIDAHNDTMMKAVNPKTFALDTNIGEETDFHIDLNKMASAGVDLLYFAAFTDDLGTWRENHDMILGSIRGLKETQALNKDRFMIPERYAEILRGLDQPICMGVHAIEGAYALTEENMYGLLKQYDDLGVRVIAPVWNHSNALGEGTLEHYLDLTPSPSGITLLGKRFIAAMNHLGIVIDVSHMNEKTFWDTVDQSQMPIIASHSGAYALKAHVRNLKDDQIKAIASGGGVVNVVFCRNFLGDLTAGVSVLVDHIEHIIQLVGVDHVGLGSDFDGATMPVDLKDISEIGKIENALISRGHSEEDVQKIMGLNNLRILKLHDDVRKNEEKIQASLMVNRGQLDFPVIDTPVAELVISFDQPLKSVDRLKGTDAYLDLPLEEMAYVLDGRSILGQYDVNANKVYIALDHNVEKGLHVLTISFWDEIGVRHYFTDIFELK